MFLRVTKGKKDRIRHTAFDQIAIKVTMFGTVAMLNC